MVQKREAILVVLLPGLAMSMATDAMELIIGAQLYSDTDGENKLTTKVLATCITSEGAGQDSNQVGVTMVSSKMQNLDFPLCSRCDVNGDGYDDVIVCARLYIHLLKRRRGMSSMH